ncbi:hypothetical protein RQP46_001226 [Phenoliferia psychrophenolica]
MSASTASKRHLVVGARSGIGYALTQELLKQDSKSIVFATVRDVAKAPALAELKAANPGRVVILELDMVDEASNAAAELAKHTSTLSTVIVNGAVLLGGSESIQDMDPSTLRESLETNVIGPHNVIRAFSPYLLASTAERRTLAIISSLGGSITKLTEVSGWIKNQFGVDFLPASSYSISKSGVNMLGRQWGDLLEPKGVAVVLVHPGSVKTDMNPGPDTIEPSVSAKGIVSVIETLDFKSTDKGIYSFDGSLLPW